MRLQMGAEQSQERHRSTEVANWDFLASDERSPPRTMEVEVEEEARDCYSWQQEQSRGAQSPQGGWRDQGWGAKIQTVKNIKHST